MNTADTIFDVCQIQCDLMKPNTSKTLSISVGGELLNFHLYKLPNGFIFDSNQTVASFFNLCLSQDTFTQVILGVNIIISSGVVLTPPFRCKGLIIYAKGTLINNGMISMTSRGCIAQGQNLYLLNDITD